MATNAHRLEKIVAQALQLSPEDRLRLIQQIAETLIPITGIIAPQPLIYGQFKGEQISTDEDFLIAEWRPTDEELNGR